MWLQVTLANESKEEELQFNLNTGSDEEDDSNTNEEDDSNTFMEMAFDEPVFMVAELLNDRLKGYFVSDNISNLSHRKLSKAEVSLLSKGLKFCPTPNTIDKSILKEIRNDNRIFDPNPFKSKSKFNPPKRDAAIELHLSRLEQNILNSGPIKHKYNNLTREERKALYDLRNDTSIIIKEADKVSVVVIWDKEDYLKEAEEQLSCKEMYEEVTDHPSYLIDAVHRTLKKIRKRGEINTNTLKYFDVEELKFGRFYFLPKIHKRLHSVPVFIFPHF